jgi:hypothetical protein
MKALLVAVAIATTICTQSVLAQETKKESLLGTYYSIKNALVNSDAAMASAKAAEFQKEISSIDEKSFSGEADFKASQAKLSKDAGQIAESKDIEKQREYFAGLSTGLFKLAKADKLTTAAVYYQYCPMKKTYWLSAAKDIKNPYYGKQMLTCGRVEETI